MTTGDKGGRANLPGHLRSTPVSSHNEVRVFGPCRAEAVTHDDADDPPGVISSDVGHRQSEVESRTGLLGEADQQSVKHGSPWSVEGITPAYGFSVTGMESWP